MDTQPPIDTTHRPQYHFLSERNWLNDPNGVIQWQGRYHLFYQYNPFGALWGNMHWGHAVSDDLVHWEHLPIAFTPTEGEFDEEGCFSGCMVINDGVPTVLYTGTQLAPVNGMPFTQHANLATGDPTLQKWEKYKGNPVIHSPSDHDLIGFRDHDVWREGDEWRQIIGAGIHGEGGIAPHYRSTNLIDWEYLGSLTPPLGETFDDMWLGTIWECPQLLDFDGTKVLVISVSDNSRGYGTAYLTGEYKDNLFTPTGAHHLDLGGRFFYAPQAFVDDRGRTVMWGWIQEGRSDELLEQAGWAGAMAIPRIVTLQENGLLGFKPAPELELLRHDHVQITPENLDALGDIKGDAVELRAVFEPGLGRVGLRVLCSADEHTTIFYDRRYGLVGIDRSHSTCQQREEYDLSVLEGTFVLPADEQLDMRIFIDKSIIEVFVNGQVALTGRVYPACAESVGIELLNDHGEFVSLDVWQMASIW